MPSAISSRLFVMLSLLMSSTSVIRTRTFSMGSPVRILSTSLSLSSSTVPSSSIDPTQKRDSQQPMEDSLLSRLRKALSKESIDAFIVPTDDPHLSEYTAPYFNRREFISKFTGSAGTAVITQEKALLFTDGRYYTQAEQELSSEWTLMRSGMKDVPTPFEYLAKTLSEVKEGESKRIVAIDPYLHAAEAVERLKGALGTSIQLKFLDSNPIDSLWEESSSRPSAPSGPVRVHPLSYAGRSIGEKLSQLRQSMRMEKSAEGGAVGILVCTALDEVAWLYNIRGSDVPCNPVTVAYAMVTLDRAYLFIDEGKLSDSVKTHLKSQGVTVLPYDKVQLQLAHSMSEQKATEGSVWLDQKSTNYAIFNLIPKGKRITKQSPIVMMKACKNDNEIEGMIACHRRDGAAVAEFLCWLFEEVCEKGRAVSEVEVDERITQSRADLSPAGGERSFVEPSFPTIAGVNSNGAIVHYRAVEESCKMLTSEDMILLDSGGQYLDGTTDVTRTFHMGTPSVYQKEIFTRVLKGHIGVDSRVFPVGTQGCLLDSYAREHLWAIGKDFMHGVGHGVGAALNVHEGPQRISRALDPHPLTPGMVISNEPGYYEAGKFGVRIENLLLVVPRPDLGEYGGRPFLGFKRLTMIPIQKRMISKELLTAGEISWLNEYHRQVRAEVTPFLLTEKAKLWLHEATDPL